MKNIGIVTFYYKNYNFGGLLQAYALPKALGNYFDILAEQIKYDYGLEAEQENNGNYIKKSYKSLYQVGILFFSKLYEKKLNDRKKVYDKLYYKETRGIFRNALEVKRRKDK